MTERVAMPLAPDRELGATAMASLEALLEHSDIVTLHVPLDSSTKGMISTPQLERMRSEAVLINTCRGTSSAASTAPS